MFTYQDRDLPKMPPFSKIHLPILQDSVLEEMNEDHYDPKQETVEPTLLKLPAGSLKGTFAKAYGILTEITNQIGWDMLLKYRSSVFVMEEEYRQEKSSSVAAIRGESDASATNTPRESEDVQLSEDEKTVVNANGNGDKASSPNEEKEESDEAMPEKPEHTVKPEEVKSGNDADSAEFKDNAEKYERLQNKRLCERWLDNLFMVLYEDLRIYTIWRSEFAQYKQQSIPYKKSASEWEILGELAGRLHHHDEALEAFKATLKIRFSPKALKGILADQEKRKQNLRALESIIKLTAWQYRWYSEVIRYLSSTVIYVLTVPGSSHLPSSTPSVN